MVYNVDKMRIEKQFQCLDVCMSVLQELHAKELALVDAFATCRALHISVEVIIDVGTVLIDGFIMRDPGSYLDIITILEDEGVIGIGLAIQLKKRVQFREKLVRTYEEVEREELVPLMDIQPLKQFRVSVNHYIEKEGV